jgi:hypothetical protein
MRDVLTSVTEMLPPINSPKLGITSGAGFANTICYPKKRRGLKYMKRIAMPTTPADMLVNNAAFRSLSLPHDQRSSG